jgi:hypothetical protein
VVWLGFANSDDQGRCVMLTTERELCWSCPTAMAPWTSTGDGVQLAIARVGDWIVPRWAPPGGPLQELCPPLHFPLVGPVDALLFASNYAENDPFTPATFEQVDILVPPPR